MTPMHDHAVTVSAPAERAPFLARAAFALGVIGLICAVSLKLSPLGFLFGVPGLLAAVVGGVQSGMQGKSTRMAVSAFVCALVAVLFWLLVRGDVANVLGGRGFWPSWIY
jgi:hypothetical protein